MASWQRLPAEIRWMIYGLIEENHDAKTEPLARAGYASVCREWQFFFEPHNFQRLVIDQDRLRNLDKFTKGSRRGFVKHVWLRIRLAEYGCSACSVPEAEIDVDGIPAAPPKNSRTFSKAVWKLLRILSKWPTHTHRDGKTGITLELAVFSPSDSQHAHKDFRLEQNYPYHETRDIDRTFDAYKLRRAEIESSSDHVNSPDHSWVHADPQKELGAKVRLLGLLQFYLKDSLVSQGFPTVKVVTGLLIRRQFYRKIPAQCVSTLLYEVCPCIEWFRHEGWHYVHPKLQSTYQNRYKNQVLKLHLPDTLKELYLFQDTNQFLCPTNGDTVNQADRPLGLKLAAASRRAKALETLSAAFLVDAKDFFAGFHPKKPVPPPDAPDALPSWKALRKLALTTCFFDSSGTCSKMRNLLIAAGRAVAYMPQLEAMEIWSGGDKDAVVFQYTKQDGRHRLTWLSRPLRRIRLYIMQPEVVWTWTESLRIPYGALDVKLSAIRRNWDDVTTYYGAMKELEMGHVVVDEMSRYQLAWEAQERVLERQKLEEENARNMQAEGNAE